MKPEEIEQTYQEHATTEAKPACFVTDLKRLRRLCGDEAVDRALANGIIKVLDDDDDDESKEE